MELPYGYNYLVVACIGYVLYFRYNDYLLSKWNEYEKSRAVRF